MTTAQVKRLRETALSPNASSWRRRRAVRRLAGHATPAAARALAEVLGAASDLAVAETARRALAGVRDEAATDQVCELLIATGDDELMALARQQGWLPSDPARRALMLFLLGEFERYAELDFDGSLLRVARAAADDGLRARLADRARTAGRVEWVRAVAGREQALGELADAEWEALIATLTATARWEQLWGLAWQAPPVWGVRMVDRLDEHEWRPADPDQRTAYDDLVRLARAYVTHPDPATFEELARIHLDARAYGSSPVRDLLATADGEWLIAGSAGIRQVWRLPANAGEQPVLHSGSSGGEPTTCLAITPDGAMLLVGNRHGVVERWSLLPTPCGFLDSVHAHTGPVRALAVTPDSSLLLIQGDEPSGSRKRDTGPTVGLWFLPSGQPAGVLRSSARWPASSMVISPDGTLAATYGAGKIWLWRLPSGSSAGTLALPDGPSGLVSTLVITPDSRMLVAAVRQGRHEVVSHLHMWWIPEGIPAGRLPDAGLYSCAVSPDGRMLADAGRDGVTLRRLPSGATIGTLTSPATTSSGAPGYVRLEFTMDGRFLVGNGHDRAQVWRLRDGELVASLPMSGSRLLATHGSALLAGTDRAGIADEAELSVWRYRAPAIDALARKPVTEIAIDEIERLLRRRPESERSGALMAFTAALAHRHHASDVELTDGAGPASATDIEVSE